ncbi:hypothetical protein [Flaviaesturariibacter amylovorans]|uniref:Uncharacterized protein n=1 Tax=Flaviaesturariibacter amylovorans TaxID=1084520 RepID=A0ABP8GQ11_9BACT
MDSKKILKQLAVIKASAQTALANAQAALEGATQLEEQLLTGAVGASVSSPRGKVSVEREAEIRAEMRAKNNKRHLKVAS